VTLKVDKVTLAKMESVHPGIGVSIRLHEEMVLPACENCGSKDTASVGDGVVGRSIFLAAATTKFKLIPNPPRLGQYFCNSCEEFFD